MGLVPAFESRQHTERPVPVVLEPRCGPWRATAVRRRGTKRGCCGVMAVFWGALPLPTSPVDPMVVWEAAVVSSRPPETLVVSYGTANAHTNQIFTP